MRKSFRWGLAVFFLILFVLMGEWTLQEAMLYNARCMDAACVEHTSNVANLRGGGALLALLAFVWSVYYALRKSDKTKESSKPNASAKK